MRIEMKQDEYEDMLACANQARELQVVVVGQTGDNLVIVDLEPSSYLMLKQWGII